MPGELYRRTSNDGIQVRFVRSGLVIEPGHDYYIGVEVSSSSANFYFRDLRNNRLIRFELYSGSNVRLSTDNLEIGGRNNGEDTWHGLIDEVRVSDSTFALKELVDGDLTAPKPWVVSEPTGHSAGDVIFADPGTDLQLAVTLDGREPQESDVTFQRAFQIRNTTTVKARVFGYQMQPSELWVKRYPVTQYDYLGPIRPRHAKEIALSNWSVGLASFPVDVGDYSPLLGALGVKSVRFKSEWARTEKTKGVYDWTWLDERVNGLVAQGIKPWIIVSNDPVYPGPAGANLPNGPEEGPAWDAWLATMVTRYRSSVNEWEIWGTPNGLITIPEYAKLVARSVAIIRAAQPEATIIVPSLQGSNQNDYVYTTSLFSQLRILGALPLINEISYYYPIADPEQSGTPTSLRSVISQNADTRHLTIRQSAGSAPSKPVSNGPMASYSWTEAMQAKWILRRMMSDLGSDIPTNIHALLEPLYSQGLIEDDPHEPVHFKAAYAAIQNVTAIFDQRVAKVPSFTTSLSSSTYACMGYRRGDVDKPMVVAWRKGMPSGTVNPGVSVSFTVSSRFSDPVLVDLYTGIIQDLPETAWTSDETGTSFMELRLRDYPMLIAESEVVLPAYDRWAYQRFGDLGLMDVNVSRPLADQDGDGVVNLLAFATAREAGDKGSPVKIVPKGDRHALIFRYRVPAAVDYVVEGSTNLKDWDPVARLPKSGVWQLEEGASILGASLDDGIHEVQVSDTDAGASEEKRFLRLRVE